MLTEHSVVPVYPLGAGLAGSLYHVLKTRNPCPRDVLYADFRDLLRELIKRSSGDFDYRLSR